MKAVVCKAWGGPEALTVEEMAAPEPGADEVKIRVRAAGVNFADTLMIAGQYQVKPSLPFSPGLEVVGEVVASGERAGFDAGQRVMAQLRWGGYAEEALAPAALVVPLPPGMDDETAAGFPIAYGTSYLALTHRARLEAGETLLVLGAAGGVGLTAVEIGKALGATVIAAAGSAEKLGVAAAHGADHVIDYRSEDLRARVKELTGGRGADVIYDPVGGDMFDAALRCINWEGRLLVIGFASGRIPQAPANIVLVKNVSVIGCPWGHYADHDPDRMRRALAVLLDWAQAGTIKPHISQRLPLAQAAEAMNLLLARRSTGKVVLTVGG